MLEDVLWLCPSLLTCLLLSAVSVAAIVFLKGRLRDQSTLPPGPRGWEALFGVLVAMREENLRTQAEKWSGQYGELVLCRTALGDLVFLNSARLVRECYNSKAFDSTLNNRAKTFFGWFLGENFKDLLTSDERILPEWPKMRKLFHRSIKFHCEGRDHMESLHTELQRVVTELEAHCGKDVIIGDFISRYLLSVIGHLMLGRQVNHDNRLCRTIKKYNDAINRLMTSGREVTLKAFPWLRFVPLTSYRDICCDIVETKSDIFSQLFDAVKTAPASDGQGGIVDFWLHEQKKEENYWLSDDHIKGVITDTIVASYVTSNDTLRAAFLYLTHNPEVQRRIQEEVDDRVEVRQPHLGDRSGFPYTEAFILETLRFTTSLGIPHEASADVIVDGYTIPKGSVVYANTFVSLRDPEVYPDPERFNPDRFLDDNGDLVSVNHPARQCHLPFGIGKRSCPGGTFAKSRFFLFVATLLQNFDFLPPSDHPLLPTTRDSWTSGGIRELKPYHVALRRRSSSKQ